MADTPTSLDWDYVHARERAAIREPDGRHDGPARPLTGLAFSGGGIRSATFNLGVIQALAELRLLRQFDYLSCVSGGGYIGGWLSAFIHLRCNGRVEDAEPQLHAGGTENSAIRFLRSYSNYLTPRASFFSADTLTAVATYLRNLYLNLTLLLLALGGLLLLPRLLVWFVRWLTGWEGAQPATSANLIPLFGGGILCMFVAMLFIGLNLGRGTSFAKKPPFHTTQPGVLLLVVLPALLSAWFIAYGFYAGAERLDRISLGAWVVWGLIVYVPPWLGGWALGGFLIRRQHDPAAAAPGHLAEISFYALLAGALGGLLLAAFAEVTQAIHELGGYSGSWIASALATALLLKFYSVTLVGHIGLMGRHFSHDSREWWARLGGWVLLVALVWAVLFSIVYVAPAFFRWAPEAFVTAGGVTWVLSTVTGVLLGRDPKTAGEATRSWRDRVAPLMPYVFIIGLLGLLSFGLHQLLMLPLFCDGCTRHADTEPGFVPALLQEASNFRRPDIGWVAILCFGSLAASVALASRIDVNLFAIYHFYRQRLVRCYLGASRCKERSPHPFTGFDPRDDLKLSELCRMPLGEPQCQRPYPIHNTAMNLVAGKQLAWQERRAAAFAFTPMASGYSFVLPDEKGQLLSHYRPTSEYMEGVWMGSAMAISGAAACPNMGYHSSPALTFLMTVFNVRLGHWSPNPASEEHWTKHDPPFGGTYLLKELFGHTQHTAPFVYLSDGGHFENLGIYELVRRRCACIVAIDAGEDADSHFGDLGNAIRKCYADFGVVIDVHAEDLEHGYSAVGRVFYPPREDSAEQPSDAYLIYIKPNLTGTEPADLLNYKCTHPGFPHESTRDQWFDESQFESYRKLGHHIGKAVFEAALIEAVQRQEMAADSGPMLPWLCEILRERRDEQA